ncbi:unnamed protein product, partial [Musa textilis]
AKFRLGGNDAGLHPACALISTVARRGPTIPVRPTCAGPPDFLSTPDPASD